MSFCWHKWPKWTPFGDTQIISTFRGRKYVAYTEHRFKRACEKCGIVSFKKVKDPSSYNLDKMP